MNLFITGAYRSGTTLLEKLLNSHEKIFVASQPYPELFIETKSSFLKEIGVNRKYPFDPMFLEEKYELKDFLEFLVRTQLTDVFLNELQQDVLEKNPEAESDWVKFKLHELTRKGDFFTIHRQLINFISKVYKRRDLKYTGSKEILCEEFIPYVARKGHKAILIIRDPRDMISSLAFGKARHYTGNHRPMLYSIRLWRKSVAFALASEENPDFMMVKYEDLVNNTSVELKKITQFLEVESFPEDAFVYGIEDQNGDSWAGNSSFGMKGNIDNSSIGIHKSVLNDEQTKYIETVCGPEMNLLDYKIFGSPLDLDQLEHFREPTDVLSSGFDDNYSSSAENIEIEKERLNKLWKEQLSAEECRKWFIFPTAFDKLRMQKLSN